MKEDQKKVLKKGAMASAGTVAGAAVGSLIDNALGATAAEAPLAVDPEAMEAEAVETVAGESADILDEAEIVYAAAPVELDEVEVVAYVAAPEAPAHAPAAAQQPAPHHPAPQHAHEPADEPIMAVAAAAAPAAAEADDLYDDIVVVSEGSSALGAALDVQPIIAAPTPVIPGMAASHEPAPAVTTAEPDYMSEPDYAMRDDGNDLGLSAIDTLEMPDYINNANIDSFTDAM